MTATPPGEVITVQGRLDASRLGRVDAHDHLFLRSPALAGQEMEDLEPAIIELREARASGLSTLVELTPIGLGRRPDLLRAAAAGSGINVIGASGYHRDAHYPPGHWVREASEDVLRDRILADVRDGMHPSDWDDPGRAPDAARAGVIKVGASYHHVSAAERRRLVAAASASVETGVAIFAHTEVGTTADEIIDILTTAGVPPTRIVLAHLDRNPDLEVHVAVAQRGVTLEYDTVGRIKYHPDSVLLDLIEGMFAAGQGAQLLLGLDLGRRDYFRAHGGGPGMRYLMETFVPRLERRIGADGVHQVLEANPARVLAVAGTA